MIALPAEGDARDVSRLVTDALEAGPDAFHELVTGLLADGVDDVAEAALTAVADWLAGRALTTDIEQFLQEVA